MGGKVHFEADVEHLPAIAMAYYQSATMILRDLAMERGNGPWVEAIREEIRLSMKNALPEGIHPDKEADFNKAALDAVDSVFNRITWRD